MFMNTKLDDIENAPSVVLDSSSLAKDRKCPKKSTFVRSHQLHQSDGDAICLLKKSALHQLLLKEVNHIESELQQHQLAIYPHLEECLPSELFEDVVEILNPELYNILAEKHVIDADTKCYSSRQVSKIEQSSLPSSGKKMELSNNSDAEAIHDQYCWIPLPCIMEKETRDKKRSLDSRKYASQSEDENIQKITTDFCSWISSLGGDNNNIEESTLTSLFASGYETKPALSVPIHVVELTSVPPELRISEGIRFHHLNIPTKGQEQNQQIPKVHSTNLMKFKYGAWYLSRNLWKVRLASEPLCDPSDIRDKEVSEAKKKSLAMDYDLAAMHGTRLFKDFVDRQDSRKPEFLQHVATINAEQKLEEQETRAQVEHQKKRQFPSAKR